MKRSRTVLVVDDDALVLENTAAMLEDLGHRVIEARSGSEALDLLQRSRGVDLVITDQAMPGMTGTQLAQQVSEVWPGLRVILASGYAELGADEDEGLAQLRKPFDQRVLADAIDAVFTEAYTRGRVVPFPTRDANAAR